MMKSMLLATVAVATFAAAPALAQDVAGSVGVTYSQGELNVLAEEELETWSVNGVAAMPVFGGWTGTVAASASSVEFFDESDESFSGSVGLSHTFGSDMRFGGFVAGQDAGEETAVTFGLTAQKYLSAATFTGVVSHTEVDDIGVLSAGGEVAFYASPAFRFGLNANYDEINEADLEAWTYGATGEYTIGSTPFAVTGGYARTDVEGLNIDTFSVGLRYTFGGSAQQRDRAGASTFGTGILSLLGNL